jgi:hypothetical protein
MAQCSQIAISSPDKLGEPTFHYSANYLAAPLPVSIDKESHLRFGWRLTKTSRRKRFVQRTRWQKLCGNEFSAPSDVLTLKVCQYDATLYEHSR